MSSSVSLAKLALPSFSVSDFLPDKSATPLNNAINDCLFTSINKSNDIFNPIKIDRLLLTTSSKEVSPTNELNLYDNY